MYATFKQSLANNQEMEEETNFCDDCGKVMENSTSDLCINCGRTEDATQSMSNTVIEEKAQENSATEKHDINTQEELQVDEEMKANWKKQQDEMKKLIILENCDDWSIDRITIANRKEYPGKRYLEYIGGIDISFVKGDSVNACAALVVLNFPQLKVVYEDLSMVELTAPYIPGFLAFREASFFVEKIEKLKQEKPEFLPQVIMVDGNGILHPNRCGLATHLGIETDIACFGVAKNLFCLPGLNRTKENRKDFQELKKAGDKELLVTDNGETLGVALRSCDNTPNPVFVSIGHKISLDTCIWLTQKCCRKRVPEPTRWADINSREYLRKHFLPKDPRQKKGQTKKQKKKSNHAESKKEDSNDDEDNSDGDMTNLT